MLDHHLQRSIVYQLTQSPGLRFSDLQPDGVENKLFTYHLKKTISAGLVEKSAEGMYVLTAEGRMLGVRVLEDDRLQSKKPHSIYFLVIRRKQDGAWLLYRRTVHPLRGLAGFMHASPVANVTAAQTARLECRQKTGLIGDFKPLGSGYFRMFRSGELESFTHFTLLVCNDAVGELTPDHAHAGYEWKVNPDFSATDMLPNMPLLVAAYKKGEMFFVEQSFELNELPVDSVD